MADAHEHKEVDNSHWRDLFFVIACFVGLVAFWFVSGGPSREGFGSLFIQSPIASSSPRNFLPFVNSSNNTGDTSGSGTTGSTNTSGQYTTGLGTTPAIPGYDQSPQAGTVSIGDYSGARSSISAQEYLYIYANSSNSGPVNITGWRLVSTISKHGATIASGVQTPVMNQAQSSSAIMLNPGDGADVTTGPSPIGISFRENECVGYLGNFQKFYPSLNQSCPYPGQELSQSGTSQFNQEPACTQAINSLSSCQTVITAPYGVSSACSDFMVQHFTYNGCVTVHRNDQNFTSTRWRIFLGQSSELWNNQSDVIVLLDSNGKLVSSVSY